MSDAAAIAAVLAVVAAVAVLLVRVYNAHVRAMHPGPGVPWTLEERVFENRLHLRAVHGTESLTLGPPVDCNADDFNMQVELARSDARERLVALNSSTRR